MIKKKRGGHRCRETSGDQSEMGRQSAKAEGGTEEVASEAKVQQVGQRESPMHSGQEARPQGIPCWTTQPHTFPSECLLLQT